MKRSEEEKENISGEYSATLNSFRYNPLFHPSVANNRQMVLAKNLHRSYHIPEGNILRLILYTEIALHWTRESDVKLYYSDLSALEDFGKNSEPVEKVIFSGKTRNLEITSPYFIENLHQSLLDLADFGKAGKGKKSGKRPASASVVKKVATELYIELSENEKLTGSKPLYIIGYIFSLYNVALKNEGPVLTEKEFMLGLEKKKSEGIVITESYLQYLGRRIRPYINRKILNLRKS
jgi:hypothetical protein